MSKKKVAGKHNPRPVAYFIAPGPCYGRGYDEDDPNCKICDLSDRCRDGAK